MPCRYFSPSIRPKASEKHYICIYVTDSYMIIENLDIVKRLIDEKENGEGAVHETTGQLERGMETLCAFLNGNGGTVLFGVNDKGKIIGQEVSDKTKRDMAEAINRLEPVAMVRISYAPLPDSEKKVIIFRVEDSTLNRPFCYKGRPYMRVESATTTMPQTAYNDLLLQRDGNRYRWELLENRNLTLQHLDTNEVLKTVRLGIECGRLPEDTGTDVPAILGKFGLLKDGVLNNAAAVLLENMRIWNIPNACSGWHVSRARTKLYSWTANAFRGTFSNCSTRQWHLYSSIFPCPAQPTHWNGRSI